MTHANHQGEPGDTGTGDSLDERLRAAGMLTIPEMMGKSPLDRWQVHAGMTDLDFFGQWLDRKTEEYARMRVAYELDDKDKSDDLYEWVLAHAGAFSVIRTNFRAAIEATERAALTYEGPGRWETGIRNIVTILHGPRHPFEIRDIVEEVQAIKDASAPNPPDRVGEKVGRALAAFVAAEAERVRTIEAYNAELKHQRERGIFPPKVQTEYEAMERAQRSFWTAQHDLLSVASAPSPDPAGAGGDLVSYLHRQWAWSKETFGPALRTKGIVQHITKELREIEAEPHDLAEWVDVIILAMDGFWRHGGKPEDLLPAMQAKQDRNFARTWPDWRTMGEDQAIEHDRSGEAPR